MDSVGGGSFIPLPHKNDKDTFVHVIEHNDESHRCRYCGRTALVVSIELKQLIIQRTIEDICPICLDELSEVLRGIAARRRRGS